MNHLFQSMSQKRKKHILLTFALLFVFAVSSFSSCRMYRLKQKLEPDDKDFLSKVRYIITQKEKKIFLELPDSERDEFKREFWQRRDPNPETEENEFKMEYFNRIENANELFVSESKPGWMTDRGRIYILFGPPTDRITYPMGINASTRCQEIWYYGSFPVVFIDKTCTGDYDLVTYDLSPIRSLNLMYMHELNLAQAQSQQTIKRGAQKIFDFNWRVKKTEVNPEKVEGIVLIDVPYINIWFKENEDGLITTLDVHLELRSPEEEMVWETDRSYTIQINEKNLRGIKGKDYQIEIPFTLKENLHKLRGGKNKIFAVLENQTGGDKQKKVMDFSLQ